MASDLRPPIIIFGNTRSGTSIVQKVMAVHPDIVGWYEPRTLWLCADPGRTHDEFGEADATEKVKRHIREQFLKYQREHGNRVVMEKTPANILKIPFVHAVFPEATYLFIVRNPFSFISSVELKWQRTLSTKGIRRRLRSTPLTQLHFYAGRFVRQYFDKRVLKRKYQAIWGPRYRGMIDDLKTEDLMTVIARQWSAPSRKAEQDLARFAPGEVLRLRYEDFVEDPISDMERICEHCGVKLTDEMKAFARAKVRSDFQDKWRRFDPRVLARLLSELEDEMARHGYEVPPVIEEARVRMRRERQSGRRQRRVGNRNDYGHVVE